MQENVGEHDQAAAEPKPAHDRWPTASERSPADLPYSVTPRPPPAVASGKLMLSGNGDEDE